MLMTKPRSGDGSRPLTSSGENASVAEEYQASALRAFAIDESLFRWLAVNGLEAWAKSATRPWSRIRQTIKRAASSSLYIVAGEPELPFGRADAGIPKAVANAPKSSVDAHCVKKRL